MLKKYLFFPLLLSFVTFIYFQASARIVETKNIADIFSEIDQDTLVLFDIDETIMAPISILATAPCWEYFQQKLFPGIENKSQWRSTFYPFLQKALKDIPQQLVESKTSSIIRSLQDRGITVLGLTGRFKSAPWDPNFAELTRNQLKKLDIDFEQSVLPSGTQLTHPPACYAYGIIFTNWKLKGPVLVQFLKEAHIHPKKIVMIDDLPEFIQSIDASLAEANIPFVGFRYGYLDDSKEFDPFIANIAFHAFITQDKVISDEEAALIKENLLMQNASLSPDFYLDEYLMQLKEKG